MNYNPHPEDTHLFTKNFPPMKLMYGEPIPMEPSEEVRWQQFQQFIKDKNLPPLGDMATNEKRLGYAYVYLYGFTLAGKSDETIFRETYDIL